MSIEHTIASATATAVADTLDHRLSSIEERLAELAQGDREERLLTRRDLAEWAGCSARTVDAWIAEGVPHVRLGGPGGSPRFRASEVAAWMKERS